MKLCSLVMVTQGQFWFVMTRTFRDIRNGLNVTDIMAGCISDSGEKVCSVSERVIFSVWAGFKPQEKEILIIRDHTFPLSLRKIDHDLFLSHFFKFFIRNRSSIMWHILTKVADEFSTPGLHSGGSMLELRLPYDSLQLIKSVAVVVLKRSQHLWNFQIYHAVSLPFDSIGL
jgi:hypothetical protein